MPVTDLAAAVAAILAAPADDRLSLQELAREEHVAPPTTWRWAMRGVRGLRLPTAMVGNRRVTTRQAYREWCEELTRLADRQHGVESVVSPSREKAIAAAEKRLAELGI